MWYKLKRIMMRPNGVEKQVRPKTWTFTYDFVNKTTTQLANDGWTNASNLTTWANWVTANSWTAIFNQISWLWTAMANATKLKIEYTMYQWWSTGGNVCWVTLITWTDAYTQTGSYASYYWYWAMCGTNVEIMSGTAAAYNTVGEWTLTAEYDFTTKVATVNFPNVYSWSASFTDAMLATARTNDTIRIPLEKYRYIKSLSITIS